MGAHFETWRRLAAVGWRYLQRIPIIVNLANCEPPFALSTFHSVDIAAAEGTSIRRHGMRGSSNLQGPLVGSVFRAAR